jgi:hypothetical protein
MRHDVLLLFAIDENTDHWRKGWNVSWKNKSDSNYDHHDDDDDNNTHKYNIYVYIMMTIDATGKRRNSITIIFIKDHQSVVCRIKKK